MRNRVLNLVLIAIALLSIGGFFNSCSSNDPLLPALPEAKAEFDNNSGGIIKGVLVGSTGVFKFSLKNGNDSVYCVVQFDDENGRLYSTDLSDWTPGEAIANTKFTGKIGATDVVVYLTCNADGTGIQTNFEIAGHFIVATPVKETSQLIVKGYEGTYKTTKISDNSTADEGIFNFVLMNNAIYGTRYSTMHNESRNIKGIVSGNKLVVDDKEMSIDDEKVSCNITVSDGEEKLVVVGKRTL